MSTLLLIYEAAPIWTSCVGISVDFIPCDSIKIIHSLGGHLTVQQGKHTNPTLAKACKCALPTSQIKSTDYEPDGLGHAMNQAAIPISTLQRSVRFWGSRIWLSSVVLPKECIQIHIHITIDYIVQTYIHHIDHINPTYTTIKVHSPLVTWKEPNKTSHPLFFQSISFIQCTSPPWCFATSRNFFCTALEVDTLSAVMMASGEAWSPPRPARGFWTWNGKKLWLLPHSLCWNIWVYLTTKFLTKFLGLQSLKCGCFNIACLEH